jgi:hypothetical protein
MPTDKQINRPRQQGSHPMRPISNRTFFMTNTWPVVPLQITLLVGLALLTPNANAAERRVALLIGNATYQHEKRLSNPVNDAELLGGVLKDTLKFDDVRIERNLNVHAMDKVVEDFAQRAKGADSVVFYYSGHGIKSPDRRSFLLPIDARTGTGDAPALDRQAVSAEAIRDKLKAAGARVTLLILDACRDGPGGGKSGSKGLARLGGNSSGLLVAYATEEDQVAQDGKGRNSPYAEALAQALKRTDLPILEQLDWVADEVHRNEPSQQPTRDGNLRAKAYLVNPPVVQVTSVLQVASIKPEPVTPASRPANVPASTSPVAATPVVTAQPVQAGELIDGRYQILSNGTEVLDLHTKLVWQRCEVGKWWNVSTCVGEGKKFTLINAKKQADIGWRTPNKDELKTLITKEKLINHYINPQAFPNTTLDDFWTDSRDANFEGRAWTVNFSNGVANSYQGMGNYNYVRLVRGGR